MKRVAIFVTLVTHCAAHLPSFPDPAQTYAPHHWKTQSEGIYMEATPFAMRLDAIAGDKLELSLSIPGHLDAPTTTDAVVMTITGPDAASIVCNPEWTGWNVDDVDDDDETRRRLSSDTLKVVPPVADPSKEYEPFGVGYYRPLRSCKGTFPATGTYLVTVTSDAQFHYSIGLGMAESWENFFVPWLLPVSLARVFHWGGRPWFQVVAPVLIFDVLVVLMCVLWKTSLFTVGVWLVLSSPISFAFQLGWVIAMNTGDGWDPKMSISLVLHIVVPVVLCVGLLWRATKRAKKWPFELITLSIVAYLLVGAWQAYFVPQVVVLAALIWRNVFRNEYETLPPKNEGSEPSNPAQDPADEELQGLLPGV